MLKIMEYANIRRQTFNDTIKILFMFMLGFIYSAKNRQKVYSYILFMCIMIYYINIMLQKCLDPKSH